MYLFVLFNENLLIYKTYVYIYHKYTHKFQINKNPKIKITEANHQKCQKLKQNKEEISNIVKISQEHIKQRRKSQRKGGITGNQWNRRVREECFSKELFFPTIQFLRISLAHSPFHSYSLIRPKKHV